MLAADDLERVYFGCGNFGGMGSSPALRDKGDDWDTALSLLDLARDKGFTLFDTANSYGGGVSERVLGDWLARQDGAYRDRVKIATKVGNPHACPPGERPLSRAQVTTHLDESLRRLGRERIDLYYLHEFDPTTPLEETLEALDRAVSAGKIAAFGVSNASPDDLRAVLVLANGALRRAFTHVQNLFNALETGDLAAVIPLCQAEGLNYVAFSPLAGGLLTGKYRADQAPPAGTRVGDAPGYNSHLLNPETFAAIETLARHAAEQVWPLPGAALRFVLDTPGVGGLIIAPRSEAQFSGYGLVSGTHLAA